MDRGDTSLLAGIAACALTLSIPLWAGDTVLGFVVGVPLGPGVFLATIPYGGPHDAAPTGPLIILASILNGVLWVGGVLAVCWLRDLIRALRA